MDISQFIEFYRSAPANIKAYEDLQQTLNIQKDLVKDATGLDKELLEEWIAENTDRLLGMIETYHRSKFLQSKNIKEKDIEELRTLYNNIYANQSRPA